MLHWLHWLKLGTVPDWFAGPALFMTLLIFRKDRRTAERAQVDLVGIWVKHVSRNSDSDPAVTLHYCASNTSSLPVYLQTLLLYGHVSWKSKEGADVRRQFRVAPSAMSSTPWGSLHEAGGPIEPGDKWSGTFGIDLAVPDDAQSFRGQASVYGATVMDNAGREWIIRPHMGYAKRRRSYRYNRMLHSFGRKI
jgi:hypothetical protein